MNKPIPIGVSPRHLHLSKSDFIKLFGQGSFLEKRKDLTQEGQFAAEQTVTLSTGFGKIEKVRVLGPFREASQVEISISDANLLGIEAPVRDSGQHSMTPGITILGPQGTIELGQGVIIAQRHIHMSPVDAREFGVQNNDIVWVAVKSGGKADKSENAGRSVIFGDVLIRVHQSFKLDFHLDTDEANAAGVKTGDQAFLIKDLEKAEEKQYQRKRVYSEWDIRKAYAQGRKILVEKGTILTPSAKDYGRKLGVLE